jgi:hypothetical protein
MANTSSKVVASLVNPEVTFDIGATYTPTQLADMLDMGPKSFRAWLRNETSREVGRGNRWILTGDVARDLYDACAKRGAPTQGVTLKSANVTSDDAPKASRKSARDDVTTSADGTVSVPKAERKTSRKIANNDKDTV